MTIIRDPSTDQPQIVSDAVMGMRLEVSYLDTGAVNEDHTRQVYVVNSYDSDGKTNSSAQDSIAYADMSIELKNAIGAMYDEVVADAVAKGIVPEMPPVDIFHDAFPVE